MFNKPIIPRVNSKSVPQMKAVDVWLVSCVRCGRWLREEDGGRRSEPAQAAESADDQSREVEAL